MASLKAISTPVCANVYYVYACFVLEFMADYFPRFLMKTSYFYI